MRCRILLPLLLVSLLGVSPLVYAQQTASMTTFEAAPPDLQKLPAVTGAVTPCVSGVAGPYACNNVDMVAFLPNSTFGASAANDIWGWTDPLTNREYALLGLNNGTAFVDVTDPVNPVYLGKLPTHTSSSSWRDVKVYADHAFIVSEASGHGVQVFDLTQLRNVVTPPVTFSNTAHYSTVNDVHNIVINEDSGFAYAVGNNSGGTTCAGGLHMIDISTPTSPTFAGCYSSDGYTHDAQCVIYNGPDIEHQGKEICLNSNEDTVTIVDVTNKATPVQLSRTSYPNASYVHQGWLTEDHTYFYEDDELDGGATRTLVWDVADLDNPIVAKEHLAATTSRDHNLYIVGDLMYQSNYTTGLRVLDISDRVNPVEVAFFDTYTPNDGTSFSGSWSNYPFLASGVVVVSSIGEGLFILQPDVTVAPPPAFNLTLKRMLRSANGVKKAVLRWNPALVSTNKIDFYVDESPDGTPLKRTANDKKVKLKLPTAQFPGDGPFAIQACEKNSTTVCSNTMMANFAGIPIDLNEPDGDDPDDAAYGKGAFEATVDVPDTFTLQGNYPNPFNPTTSIHINLPEAALVHVEVFDVLGRRVLTTPGVALSAGAGRSLTLDGSALTSGRYVYRVVAQMKEAVQTAGGQLVLVK